MKSSDLEYARSENLRLLDKNVCPAGWPGTRSAAQDNGQARPLAARKIEQSIAYMRQHLNQPLQVATLAATVNVSPSHFFALFKRWSGCSPIDYFIRLRMQRARRLLEQTSLSVKEIASEMGYNDPFYFSRAFKSVYQMAPSDYRAAQREMAVQTKNGGEGSTFTLEPKLTPIPVSLQFA
jgi:transcriptional regulator GlxA family with amidase domain